MAEIRHLLRIKASPEKVYRAISTQEGLASWWTRDTSAEARVGALAEFGFNNRSVLFKMRVDKLEENKTIEWTCVGGHPEWENTRLFFRLEQAGENTVLRFGHVNWQSAEGILPQCSFDWARYLMSLRDYIETGQGNPHLNSF